MRKSLWALIFCAVFLLAAASAQNPPSDILQIKATILKPLVDEGESSAEAINEAGLIVGYGNICFGIDHAVLWLGPNQPVDLGTLPGGLESYAKDINSRGEVVGYSLINQWDYHAFLIRPEDRNGDGEPDTWFKDDNHDGANDLMIDLGTLGGNSSDAVGINDSGVVVGRSNLDNFANGHAFIWDGQMTQLKDWDDIYGSGPRAINERGEVVGFAYILEAGRYGLHGALWNADGIITDLGDPLGGSSDAWDINIHGLIVGSAYDYIPGKVFEYPVIWEDKAYTLLDKREGDAFSVNILSEIVGGIKDPDLNDFVPALWQNGLLVDLSLFENPGSRTVVADNNDLGLMVGSTNITEIFHDPDGIRITRTGVLWKIIETAEKAKERIDAVRVKVDKLVEEGKLTAGQANALKKKLDEAAKLLEAKAEKTAVGMTVAGGGSRPVDVPAVANVLKAFINQVEAFIKARILTEEDGQALIQSVRAIIARIGG